MLPDPVSNPGPLTYESGALPITGRVGRTVITLEFPSFKECRRSVVESCIWRGKNMEGDSQAS